MSWKQYWVTRVICVFILVLLLPALLLVQLKIGTALIFAASSLGGAAFAIFFIDIGQGYKALQSGRLRYASYWSLALGIPMYIALFFIPDGSVFWTTLTEVLVFGGVWYGSLDYMVRKNTHL